MKKVHTGSNYYLNIKQESNTLNVIRTYIGTAAIHPNYYIMKYDWHLVKSPGPINTACKILI
jgi:hypothetical protein